MRLRTQLILVALCASLALGSLGAFLFGRTLHQATDPLLERTAILAEQAVLQRWRSERHHRRQLLQYVTQRASLRAYLLAGDRDQLAHIARTLVGSRGQADTPPAPSAVGTSPSPAGSASTPSHSLGIDSIALTDRSGEIVSMAAATPMDEVHTPRVAIRAIQEALGPDGELVAINDALWEVYRLPIGSDLWAGHLIAAYRLSPSALSSLTEGLEIGIAVLHNDVAASTFPPTIVTKPRTLVSSWTSDSRRLREQYRVRVAVLGHATLIIGTLLSTHSELVGHAPRQAAAVLALLLLATLFVVFAGIERITRPIEQLKDAADQLGRGQLLRARSLLQDFSDRNDEIGTLASAFNVAAQRLNSFVASSMRLVRHLGTAVSTVERSANSLAAGAAKQEQRLNEVASIMAPLLKSLNQTTQALGDARTSAISLSLVSNATDQAMALLTTGIRRTEALLNNSEGTGEQRGSYRTASLLQQIAQVGKLHSDLRDSLLRLRDHVGLIKNNLDEAVEVHVREQHQSEHLGRATGEVDRLAKQHAGEAVSLRGSAQQLRRDIEHLSKLLSAMESNGPLEIDETVAASSGFYSPIRAENGAGADSALGPPSRRSGRSASADDLVPASRRSMHSPQSATSSKPDHTPVNRQNLPTARSATSSRPDLTPVNRHSPPTARSGTSSKPELPPVRLAGGTKPAPATAPSTSGSPSPKK